MLDATWDPAVIALGVSGASAVIALVSLGWTIYTAVRLNVARIKIVAAVQHVFGVDDSVELITATVTNVGRAATKVVSLWVMVGSRPTWIHHLLPRTRRPRQAIVTRGYRTDLFPMPPVVLQPGDDVTVALPIEVIHQALFVEKLRTGARVHALVATSTAGSRRSRNVGVDLAR